MISLVAGQRVSGAPGYFVTVTGDFDPLDLVPCATEPAGAPICAFLAIFCATGRNEV